MAGQTHDRSAPSQPPFDARPAQVEEWVAGLPLANLGESSRLLFAALTDTNGRELPAEQRFRLLELIGQPLHTVVTGLSRHFIGKPCPLGDKHRQVFQLVQALMNLMAAGYRRVVEDGGEKRGILRDNRQVMTAAHRALDYLGQALLRAYQVYAPYPVGVWQHVHRLYQFAEKLGCAQIAVKDAADGTQTIEDAYKRILLLALACPYRLRPGEAEQVYQWLGSWAQHATLSRLVDTGSPNSLFVTHFESDEPPTYRVLRHTEHDPEACRLLNASRLADTSRTTLAPLRDADNRVARPVNEQVLRRLMLAWGVLPKRRFTRTQKHSTAVVAMGLSAAHYFIGGEIVFEEASGTGGEPLFNSPAHFEICDTRAPRERTDVWELSDAHLQQREPLRGADGGLYIDFAAPDQPSPRFVSQSRSVATSTYHTHEWKMINVSAGGYCLLWDKTADSQAQVGELLGLRDSTEPDSFHLSLGVVRWMKQSAELGLELGVEMLSPGAVAVGTKLHKLGGSSEYLRSLLLPAVKAVGQPATLLTPALPYHVGNILMVNSHGKEARVQLTKLVENTGSFAQFQFRPLESHASTSEAPTGTGHTDEFAALWSQI